MLLRITDLVNAALEEGEPDPGRAPLTPAQVADLVDLGCSGGGRAGRHWVLDPIDGTRGFVGRRQYAVCLGMLEEGQVRRRGGAQRTGAARRSTANSGRRGPRLDPSGPSPCPAPSTPCSPLPPRPR